MATDCLLRKGMRFLLLLPRTLSGCWVLKYCMHCVPQTFLWEHLLENRKERGTIRDLFAYISLPNSPLHNRSQPMYFPLQQIQVHSSISLCCAHSLCFCQVPPELPAHGGPCSSGCAEEHPAVSQQQQGQPVQPQRCCAQVGAQELRAEPGWSCIEHYWSWQWLEHLGFCIRVILTLQFHQMQLHFKWSCNYFSGTSDKKKQSKFGWESTRFNKFKPLAFSGFFCYLNRKLHGFRQSAHLQFFSLLFLCCWEPHNVLPCQLLKCF